MFYLRRDIQLLLSLLLCSDALFGVQFNSFVCHCVYRKRVYPRNIFQRIQVLQKSYICPTWPPSVMKFRISTVFECRCAYEYNNNNNNRHLYLYITNDFVRVIRCKDSIRRCWTALETFNQNPFSATAVQTIGFSPGSSGVY